MCTLFPEISSSEPVIIKAVFQDRHIATEIITVLYKKKLISNAKMVEVSSFSLVTGELIEAKEYELNCYSFFSNYQRIASLIEEMSKGTAKSNSDDTQKNDNEVICLPIFRTTNTFASSLSNNVKFSM